MNDNNKEVYQVIKYRIENGEADAIRIGKTYSVDYSAVEAILSMAYDFGEFDLDIYDYEDRSKEFVLLLDELVPVIRIASYDGISDVTYCYGIYAIELQ